MESLEARPEDIVIEKGRLLINGFETSDEEVVTYFEEIEPQARMQRLKNVKKTGVIALKTVGIAQKIDYIEKEFARMNTEFNKSVENTLEQLDDKIESIFGEDGEFAEVIKGHFGEDGKIIKELFDPSRQGTPLNTLRNEVRNEINSLKTDLKLDSQKESIEKKTPLKGYKFEDVCEVALSNIARHNGDKVERTSDIVGCLRPSKKGDFVIELKGTSRKIVYEVKDMDNRLTFPGIDKSIEEAIQNRNASYGVFLVKNVEALPQSVGWFNEYGDNKLVCALGSELMPNVIHEEVLHISYNWAKMRVFAEAMNEKKIDSAFIENRISEVRKKLHGLNKVKVDCTSIENSIKDIRNVVEETQSQIDNDLSEILKSLTPA